MRFQFFYPSAVDLPFGDFKLFTAYFKRGRKDRLELLELKRSETNFDTIRCASCAPFEEIIIEFLTALEEDKKVALFEEHKALYEYESLCARKAVTEMNLASYLGNVPPPLQLPTA